MGIEKSIVSPSIDHMIGYVKEASDGHVVLIVNNHNAYMLGCNICATSRLNQIKEYIFPLISYDPEAKEYFLGLINSIFAPKDVIRIYKKRLGRMREFYLFHHAYDVRHTMFPNQESIGKVANEIDLCERFKLVTPEKEAVHVTSFQQYIKLMKAIGFTFSITFLVLVVELLWRQSSPSFVRR